MSDEPVDLIVDDIVLGTASPPPEPDPEEDP
jgi:hypothetical protein